MEEEGDNVMEKLGTDDIIDIVKGRVDDDFEDEDEEEEAETGATFGLFGDPSAKEDEEEEDLNAKYNHVSQSNPDLSIQGDSSGPGASTYQESYPPPQAANPYQQVRNSGKRLRSEKNICFYCQCRQDKDICFAFVLLDWLLVLLSARNADKMVQ